MVQFSGTHISQTTRPISFKFGVYECIYEGIKYVNLIEIGLVIIEIQEVENGELVDSVNNTLVRHMAFLAADTRLCVLIRHIIHKYLFSNFSPLCSPVKEKWKQ